MTKQIKIKFHVLKKTLNPQFQNDAETVLHTKNKVILPKKYKVLLHNDDYTTMEFVISILQGVFHKNVEDAERIMLEVHQNGVGVCGVYTFEISESLCQKVMRLSKENSQPLICTIEAE